MHEGKCTDIPCMQRGSIPQFRLHTVHSRYAVTKTVLVLGIAIYIANIIIAIIYITVLV